MSSAFVDGIEEGVVRLWIVGQGQGRAFHLPVQVLPPLAGESSWIEIRVRLLPARPDGLRQRLGAGDRGGDVILR